MLDLEGVQFGSNYLMKSQYISMLYNKLGRFLSSMLLIGSLLFQTHESRVVLHFHYTCWPDFGVPQTPDLFLEFLEAVRGRGVLSEDVGPCVVHCSAGIGRSGTFCLVDVCLAKVHSALIFENIDESLIKERNLSSSRDSNPGPSDYTLTN